ncbi:formyl transferase [Halioglobus maricola]|uniref:Formyl transferase n=1 Tax=Halioglobus maricola TaxID=2601894 RepID=A0A5P9NIZ9_9GAMM|nr:formyl transferase [Halioglobus maricola]QFU75496.1 formyl transferase [Halioglobus maricola]
MKLVILSNHDVASYHALSLLLPRLQEHEIQLMLSSAVGGKKRRAQPLEDLKAIEQDISFDALKPLIAGEAIVENAINAEAAVANMQALAPDLIISIRYGGILKNDIISIPRCGVINLHSGKLPEYRGVMATFWAMLNGENEITATLHYISDGTIDTGGVIAEAAVAVNYQASYLENVLSVYPGGCKLICDAVEAFARGEALEGKIQQGDGGYYTFPEESDLAAFSAKGLSLFTAETQ